MEVISDTLLRPTKIPAWTSIRLWMLRVGYYKLLRTKEKADDWVWIMDHTIQLGNDKCLLIVGVRLCNLPEKGHCLRHEDVEPLGLFCVTQSNGEIVRQQLEQTVCKTGAPRQIVSDGGSDLHAGIGKFIAVHPETSFVYDIKHKAACILKRELEPDAAWKKFVQSATHCRSCLQQTALAALMPPSQRSKARYMNIASLLQWADQTLPLIQSPMSPQLKGFDSEKVIEKLSWLNTYRLDIQQWKSLFEVIKTTEDFVRKMGHYTHSDLELKRKLDDLIKSQQAERVAAELTAFTKEQSSKAKADERLLGSSEELESLLGRLKYLERDQAKSGMTGLVLSAAAMASKTTAEVVQLAMETVSVQDVLTWCKKEMGETVQAARRRIYSTPDAEQM